MKIDYNYLRARSKDDGEEVVFGADDPFAELRFDNNQQMADSSSYSGTGMTSALHSEATQALADQTMTLDSI